MSHQTRTVWIGYNPEEQRWYQRRRGTTPNFNEASIFNKRGHLLLSAGGKKAVEAGKLIPIGIDLTFDDEDLTLLVLGHNLE